MSFVYFLPTPLRSRTVDPDEDLFQFNLRSQGFCRRCWTSSEEPFFFFFDNLKQIPSYLSCSGPWFSTSNFFEAFTHIHYLEKSGWCSDAPRDSQHPWKKQTKSQHWNISVSNQDFSACTLWLTQSDNHSNLFLDKSWGFPFLSEPFL